MFNPLRFLQRSENGAPAVGHMTWASRTVSKSASRAGQFFRTQLWVRPLVAVLILTVLGIGVRWTLQSTMQANLRSGLETLLTLEVGMLERWYDSQITVAETIAADVHLRDVLDKLLVEPDDDQIAAPMAELNLPAQLQRELAPDLSAHDFAGYFVADRSKRIVASSYKSLVGKQDVPEYDDFLTKALEGQSVVSPPFPSVAMIKSEAGTMRTGLPEMYVCVPIRDERFQAIGVLALQIRPEHEFSRILALGRVGSTGETYAFNKDGLMVSDSRFDEQLILLGVLPDQDGARSMLMLQVRDPGGDMTEGHRPTERRAKLPLTKMAADAIAGNSSVDLDGYRDYRGVPVVGAWKWLPERRIGVATEVDVAQAFGPLIILQRVFWGLYVLLILLAGAIFVFTLVLSRVQREARRSAVQAQQLGQYTLEQKLGTGAMGVVFKGQHAMLRRPTAIKMLDVDRVNDESIRRFEREVQLTCQLNHPNTIAIYDYGRTPEGVFYYAMEYLDGITLQSLVDRQGPQPEHRVIHILRQICGSLYEAHSLGLVHRDIKPANVMINRRGGESDVVKVLDFGLVKALDEHKRSSATTDGSLTGTPLYMSPEAIESPLSVDARSDLYAVGAIGYFLITGRPVFQAANLVELCQKQVDEVPRRPSELAITEVSVEFESALLACLEKSRAKRPQTARDLALLLERSPAARAWTPEDADDWWRRHDRGPSVAGAVESDGKQAAHERTVIGESTSSPGLRRHVTESNVEPN